MGPVARRFAFGLGVLSGGCVGEIGGGAESTPGAGPGESAEGISAAWVPLRRLTGVEFDNTVRDLLGDTTHPATSFPPDEATSGYESNNTSPVTDVPVQRYLEAAEALAAAAISHMDAVAPCADASTDECAASFIETFGRRAFRRPLDAAEIDVFMAVYAERVARSDHAGGIQLVLQTMLQSPQFLYRIEAPPSDTAAAAQLTGYDVATRLSYFLWASTPDDDLLDAAGSGALDDAAGIEAEARRMLDDPRATDAIRSFHRQWLRLRELSSTEKDAGMFPEFTLEARAAMQEETLRFSTWAVEQGGDTLQTLLTSPLSFVNADLAAIYGLATSSGDFELTALPSGQRSGILTHPSVMSLHSSANQTSPILRGKFVRENLLCQPIPPPPADVNVTLPPLDPTLTTKERFAAHRDDPSCAACHELMDPIGFSFEHYDAIGRWRTVDGEFPVDSTGEITGTEQLDGPIDGTVQLGELLATSAEVRACMTRQWFRFALGRGERDQEEASMTRADERFGEGGRDVRELLIGIALSDAFRFTRSDEGAEP